MVIEVLERTRCRVCLQPVRVRAAPRRLFLVECGCGSDGPAPFFRATELVKSRGLSLLDALELVDAARA